MGRQQKQDIPHRKLSYEEILHELNVSDKAFSDAQSGIPKLDSTSLTTSELGFVTHFKNDVLNEKERIKTKLDEYKAALAKIFHSEIIEHLKGLPEDLKRLNHETLFKEEQGINSIREEFINRQFDLRKFASDNELIRAPQPQHNPMQVVFWIIAIVLMETCLNATFFAVGSDRGLLGGAIQAFIISFLNVMLAWFLGRLCLPQLQHISPARKYLGGGIGFLLVVGVFILNMFAGHYRSALEEDAFQAVLMAVRSFHAGVFEIKSAQGWLLTAVGIVACTSLTTKILFSDDPYPGYGKKYRQLLKAEEAWLNKQREVTDSIIANYTSTEASRSLKTTELTDKEVEYSVLLKKANRLGELYATYLPNTEGLCNKVICHYRQKSNDFFKRGSVEPPYFSEEVVLRSPEFQLDLDLEEAEACQIELVKRFDDYRDTMSGPIKEALVAIHNDQITSLKEYFGNA